MSEHAVFARKSSGILRNVGLFDVFMFAIIFAIPFAANLFLFPLYVYFLPGANWTVAILIGLLFSVPNYFVYAGFGSMMPRAGGDYVWMSRSASSLLATIFTLAWECCIVQPLYAVLLLFGSVTLGVVPLLTAAGVVMSSSALANAATWLASPSGLFTFEAAFVILAFLVNFVGLKWVARAQRYILLPVMIISGITIPALLLTTSAANYVTSFNGYVQALNGTSNGYNTIVNAAMSAHAIPSTNWFNTLLLGVVIAIEFLMWCVWSAPLFGEIKGANSFRGLLISFFAGAFFQVFFLLIPEFASFLNTLGWNFVNAVSYQVYVGVPSLSFYPSMGMLILFATHNVLVMVLASIGFIVAGYFFTTLAFANVSRYFLAGSIDGVIPAWFSSTSKRFKAPTNGLLAALVMMLIYATAIFLVPSDMASWEIAPVWLGATLFLGTGIAAILVPRTNAAMYKSSPVARFRGLLGVGGAITIVICLFSLIAYLVVPSLEIGLGPYGAEIIVGSLILAVLWYEFFKWFQKRRGIDIGLAYKELPPE